MRVALIGHHVAPIAPPFVGGVESQTWYLARWLAKRGHDVTLFALPGTEVPGVTVRPLSMGADIVSEQARRDVSTLPDPFLAAHHAYLELMLELSGHCPFDVVHVNTLHYLPVAMAQMVPVPVVLTLHCPPTPWLESALRAAAGRGALPLEVTSVSPSLSRSWAHVLPVADVIGNGIDLDTWRPGPGGDHCVWFGRIVPEKAPHLAIDAARLAGRAIQLAGPVIDQAYWDREIAPRLGDDVRYLGHLAHGALGVALGRAAVSVQSPVWDEPFGLTAAESIACGTPVASFARGGLPEVIGHGGGSVATTDDAAGLADAIHQAAMLDRDAVRGEAELRLSVDAMGERYDSLYRSLVADRTRATEVPVVGPGRAARVRRGLLVPPVGSA